jgi:hypothetical protein
MHHPENVNVPTLHTVDDRVPTHGGATHPGAEVFIAGSSNIWEVGQKEETAGDRVNQASGGGNAATLSGDVKPDVIQIGLGLGRYPLRHYREPANSAIRRARPRSVTSAASSRMDS